MTDVKEFYRQLMGNPDCTDYKDSKCCPYYICGFCPYELFANSKLDMGYCDKTHSDALKQQFEAAQRTETLDHYYDDFERVLRRFLAECDRKVKKSHERRHAGDDIQYAEVETNPTTLQLLYRIKEVQNQAIQFAEEGDTDKAIKCQERVEELKTQKFTVQARYILEFGKSLKNTNTATPQERLRLCDVCGALLAVNDTEVRLADHFGGKIHLGYLAIKEKLKELEERKKLKEDANAKPATNETDKKSQPKESKSRSRSKSKSRSNSRSNSRNIRHRRRSRSRSDSHSRSRRHRGSRKERRRSRSRSRRSRDRR